ncbi:inactive ribonuclease-like protein 10 [Petaurus breviceps papuanus]|uniref:inactive ribonuclease-like protein 10 n=1 Tax=Petaurus breviceps papuanus TaxID=3040969 RepID=UPI0036DA8AEB
MKSVLLQTFPVMLLLLLGLGLGLGLRLWLAFTKLEDIQELLNQLWKSDSWEEAETTEDTEGIKATELQGSGKNDLLLLDEVKMSMEEASEKEVTAQETPVIEELFQKEAIFYSRQLKNNRDCNVMIAQKLGPKGTCKEKYTFIHEHYDKVRAICATPNIPCKEKGSNYHQSREPSQ